MPSTIHLGGRKWSDNRRFSVKSAYSIDGQCKVASLTGRLLQLVSRISVFSHAPCRSNVGGAGEAGLATWVVQGKNSHELCKLGKYLVYKCEKRMMKFEACLRGRKLKKFS
ncbi:hypothetical protein V6N12_001422 [Hibiscus sabdariffa]|uniref:Uncharacterized protein n=1 Tax=Hibiscus sabdariffa TaxID=183260 RepID=A0ABR2AA25_9ROSI